MLDSIIIKFDISSLLEWSPDFCSSLSPSSSLLSSPYLRHLPFDFFFQKENGFKPKSSRKSQKELAEMLKVEN